MTGFFAAVVILGLLFAVLFDNVSVFYGAIVLSLTFNFFSYWFADKLVMRMTGAEPASASDYPDLVVMIENLSHTVGIPTPKLYIINDPAPNAFATGRDKKHAAVAVTTGLIPLLEKNELEGVLAHELSHIGNRDMLVSMMAVALVGVVSILANFLLRVSWMGNDRGDRAGGLLFIAGILASILAPIAAGLIQLAVSRKREFLADASGALLTKYPEGLARALEKISKFPQPMKNVSSATAHIFIANPMGHSFREDGSEEVTPMTRLFMTHPPVQDRIKALLKGSSGEQKV